MPKTLRFVVLFLLLLSAPVSASEIFVPAGGNLQAALTAAQPGDEIVLQAGAVFVGTFVLPVKPNGPAIVVRSSSALPLRRITPADVSLLPTLASGSTQPALTCTGSANWKLVGLQFFPTTEGHSNLIEIQDCANITIDRMLFVTPDSIGQRRVIMGNGQHITLTRSHIAGAWSPNQDSQAFCAWDGSGPYTITDNYLEAGSENVMFGGANSRSADRIPADILIEGNHFSKPLAWKGLARGVKNLFELKSAKRVTIRNNIFENNWTDAQNGYAILFTVRNDEGQSPWSVVEDVLFENNIVRNVENGVNILGYDSYQASGRTTRVVVRNNTIQADWKVLQVGGEAGVVSFINNTTTGDALLYKGGVWPAGEASREALYAAEVFSFYGNSAMVVYGDSTTPGQVSLEAFTETLIQTPPTNEPPPPPPDNLQLSALAAELAAVKTALANTQNQVASLTATVAQIQGAIATLNIKVTDVTGYLAVTPTVKNLNQLVNYLRMIPR